MMRPGSRIAVATTRVHLSLTRLPAGTGSGGAFRTPANPSFRTASPLSIFGTIIGRKSPSRLDLRRTERGSQFCEQTYIPSDYLVCLSTRIFDSPESFAHNEMIRSRCLASTAFKQPFFAHGRQPLLTPLVVTRHSSLSAIHRGLRQSD